jgi:hypothetical protein
MHSKVSSDWLQSSIKATRPVLAIFKMALYFPDRPRTHYFTTHLAVSYFSFFIPLFTLFLFFSFRLLVAFSVITGKVVPYTHS